MHKIVRVLIIDDGYHDPSCFFENGAAIYGGNKAFLSLLCKPHKEEFIIYHFFYDDVDEDSEEAKFIREYESMYMQDRTTNFHKAMEIYEKVYLSNDEVEDE